MTIIGTKRSRIISSRYFFVTTVITATSALIISTACSDSSKKNNQETEKAERALAENLSPLIDAVQPDWTEIEAAGIKWWVPSSWEVGPPRPMRVGTFFAQPVEGDTEPAEMKVNFFGSGQGGNVEENIKRWEGQFTDATDSLAKGQAAVIDTMVNGVKTTLVEVTGVFLSSPSPMSRVFTRKHGFIMFGAIIAAPEGAVFFKMTGPAATMEANRELFRQSVGSIQPL